MNVTRFDDEMIFRQLRERIAELRATGMEVRLAYLAVVIEGEEDRQILRIPAHERAACLRAE